MTTITQSPPNDADVARRTPQMRVSSYDQVSGTLVTLLIVVGVVAAVLFCMWLSKSIVIRIRSAPSVTTILDEPMGRGDHAEGYARDFEEPGVEELADVAEPQLAGTLDGVAIAVSSQAAALDGLEGGAFDLSEGAPLGNSNLMGTGRGKGDSRPPGPEGEGNASIVPRWERWEVRYTTTDIKAYAAQLDFFKVELAAVGGGKPLVDYASSLSSPKPTTRTSPSKTEKRLRLTWTGGSLKDFDQQLLRQAGIETNRRLVMQFYTPEAENLLAGIETKEMAARNKKLDEIKKTVFGVRPARGGFEFFLISQDYRAAPR